MNYLNKKTVEDIDVAGKRVLVRCDFNVPFDAEGNIADPKRIDEALKTIKYLVSHNARVILCSHLGRPKGEFNMKYSLAPVAKYLSQALGQEVKMASDVVGESAKSIAASLKDGEVELIETTAKALLKIGMKDFTVKVNDRRILRAMLETMGFAEQDLDGVCIVFDKLDKVGVDGVRAELTEKGYAPAAVEALCATLNGGEMTLEKVAQILPENPAVQSVSAILSAAQALADGRYGVKFDLSLVRGQGYYTGTVFEIESNEFRGAIAGGGRYDNLIGKFTNETVPAVGFSIGFERIFGILSESGFAAPKRKERIALFCEEADAAKAAALAESLRATYSVSLLARPKKLGKALQRLEADGFAGYLVFGEGEEVKRF